MSGPLKRSTDLYELLKVRGVDPIEFIELLDASINLEEAPSAGSLMEILEEAELIAGIRHLHLHYDQQLSRILFERETADIKRWGEALRDRRQLMALRFTAYLRINDKFTTVGLPERQVLMEVVFAGDYELAYAWFTEELEADLFGFLMGAWRDPLLTETQHKEALSRASRIFKRVDEPHLFFGYKVNDPGDSGEAEDKLMSYINRSYGAEAYDALMF